jgi:hypothetical protein
MRWTPFAIEGPDGRSPWFVSRGTPVVSSNWSMNRATSVDNANCIKIALFGILVMKSFCDNRKK